MGLQGWLFRETILSYLSGAVFAAGWWVWIDACVNASITATSSADQVQAQYYIPGVVSTVAVFLINALSWAQINGNDQGFFAESQNVKAKIWFFVSFAIAFGALFAALWIGIQHWLTRDVNHYPGVAIIVQNGMIFFAAVIYRFAKPQVDEFGEPLLSNS